MSTSNAFQNCFQNVTLNITLGWTVLKQLNISVIAFYKTVFCAKQRNLTVAHNSGALVSECSSISHCIRGQMKTTHPKTNNFEFLYNAQCHLPRSYSIMYFRNESNITFKYTMANCAGDTVFQLREGEGMLLSNNKAYHHLAKTFTRLQIKHLAARFLKRKLHCKPGTDFYPLNSPLVTGIKLKTLGLFFEGRQS